MKLAKDNSKSSKPLQLLRSPQYYNHAHFLEKEQFKEKPLFCKSWLEQIPTIPICSTGTEVNIDPLPTTIDQELANVFMVS